MAKVRTGRLGLIVGAALIGSLLTAGGTAALPAGTPKTGIVCTPGSVSGSTHTFALVANDGYIQTPDGNAVYMWSYSVDGSPDFPTFQSPGPVLCVTEGQQVEINLRNELPDPVSIVFPGQDAEVTASGDAAGLFTQEAAAGSGSARYSFVAGSPGTYLYESGTDVAKQVEMGLYGALVVRPASASNLAYDDPSTSFGAGREFLLLLGEIDPDLHHAVETGGAYDFTAKHNRYFTVNSRAFPDTLQDNGSSLLPNQPYGSLVRIQPNDATRNQPALIRMLNAGVDNHPFHPHGNHLTEIAQDGRLLLASGGVDSASTERFGESIGSGQTQDYLLRWDNSGSDTSGAPFNDDWNPVTNPLPVPQPNYQNLTFKDGNTWYSGSPYLGFKGTLPTGTNSLNVCGEWFFPWHSHALNEFANFDEPFGGMATLLRVDPLGGCAAFPTSTSILAGTPGGGSVTALGIADQTYYKVISTTGGTPTSDWYGQFSAIPAGSANLNVTYTGNDLVNSTCSPTQDFGSLASSGTTGTILPACWAFSESGGNTTYGIGDGSSATANTYSFGSTASPDRAFGTLRGTGGLNSTIGAAFTNTTGLPITALTINYVGEQWRHGNYSNVAAPDRLDFAYSTNATNLTNGTWTNVDPLDFASPVTTGSARALDGNASANRTVKSFTISGLSIPNGTTYRIRWTDFDHAAPATAEDGLAVDSFTISTAPTTPSPTAATNVYLWNWTTSSWTQVAGPTTVGASDVTITSAVPAAPVAGSWASYVGTGVNKGRVRVRIQSSAGSGFVTGGNLMKLVYDAP
jgi:Multicopper oxidase